MIFIAVIVIILVLLMMLTTRHKINKKVITGSDDSVPYLGAFWKYQPVSWYDKAQLIMIRDFIDQYNPTTVKYISDLLPGKDDEDILSAWLGDITLDRDSDHLIHMQYIYSKMGSGYFNPTYSYEEPITEYIQQHNSLCREHLTALLKYLKESKPKAYTCLLYIPTDIKSLKIPSGEIKCVPYSNPSMPGLYVKGQDSTSTQTIDSSILDTIFNYYMSGNSTPEIDTDEYLGNEMNYSIRFRQEYRSFRNLHKDMRLFNTQLKLEARHKVPFSRIVSMDDRRLPYRYSEKAPRALHWGQRKLFMSELEFLTLHGHLSRTIVYVGAASGEHTIYLSKLFPHHRFILYDPRDFAEGLKPLNNVEIHQQFFTDDDVEQYKGRDVLFICDMRVQRDRTKGTFDEEFESMIQDDMKMQMAWHLEMEPIMSMFKFRLSFVPGSTPYLKGELRYQVWAPPTSTELRLITNSRETTHYDNTLIEEILFRFNKCTRFQSYNGLPYDDKAEQVILQEYITSLGSTTNMKNEVKRMQSELDKVLGSSVKEKKSRIKNRF